MRTIKSIYDDPKPCRVELAGWLRFVRDSKAVCFLELNDGSTVKGLQLVAEAGLPGYAEISALNVGTAVRVCGDLVLTPEARQPFELKLSSLIVEGTCPPEYPLQKKRHSLEYLRTIAHLRPRTNTFSCVFRLRSEAAFAIHEFFHSRGFVYAHTPIITGSDAEGAGEMFRVTTLPDKEPPLTEKGEPDYTKDFFGKKTSLTVSGQLQAEAFAQAFGRTYTFGPTFRAENSNTPRHAAEFWMIEPEAAFFELSDDMALAEDMLKHVLQHCLENCAYELEFLNNFVDKELLARLQHVESSEFARLSYTDAVKELEKRNSEFQYPVSWGSDLQTEHERYLTEKLIGLPVFVTDYPKEIKAFYMRANDDGKTVAAMDMLVAGVGELIGGSQREERTELLLGRMAELGLDAEDYSWYMDLRKYGGVKHSGFGLGFERLVMYLTGMTNIRDVSAFPRVTGSCEF